MKSGLGKILFGVYILFMAALGMVLGLAIYSAASGENPIHVIQQWGAADQSGTSGKSKTSGEDDSGTPDGGSQSTSTGNDDNDNNDAPVDSEPDSNAAAQPVSSSSGNLGDYYVDIKGAEIVDDYEGNPAIVITYAWTNNSDDTTYAAVSVYPKAFQDGVQLSNAMIIGSDKYEMLSSATQVRPGTTIDVQTAFELPSQTSIVEFELSELVSLSSDIISMNFDPANL